MVLGIQEGNILGAYLSECSGISDKTAGISDKTAGIVLVMLS